MTIAAKIIADSISPDGIRLTTMQITLHRYVLAEFNTHRQFSRNFRSSRAVPVAKLLGEVRVNPAMPVAWLKNRPGMQASEPMSADEEARAREEWLRAANDAADHAERLAELGLHKQWANRGLEPYLYVHGVVTATEWANFYALRRHPDAQPEMKALADAMWEAQQASEPKPLRPGEWHLPYVRVDNLRDLRLRYGYDYPGPLARTVDQETVVNEAVRVSVARCARVSYLTHEGKTPSVEDDLRLYDRLVGSVPLHASPAEHQATPDAFEPEYPIARWAHPELHANLVGWVQHRRTLPNESVKDHDALAS